MGIPDINKRRDNIAWFGKIKGVLEIKQHTLIDLQKLIKSIDRFINPEPQQPADDKTNKSIA